MSENMDGEFVEELTWANSGLSIVERAILRKVAEQHPAGAYAEFVRLMDFREEGKS